MHTIMFVDDEKAILRSLNRLFVNNNIRLFFAESGKQALEILAQHHIDLVISDMRMPQMDGHKLLTEVKRRYPYTSRFILSGFADENEVYTAVLDGSARKYLLKPWDPGQLLLLIKGNLSLRDTLVEKNILGYVEKFSAIPADDGVRKELLEILKTDASTSEIATIIENDVGITAKVMQVVNSSANDKKVGSVRQAVANLGKNTLKNILMQEDSFELKDNSRHSDIGYYHIAEHGRMTSRLLTLLSECSGEKWAPEQISTAALLHDLGLIIPDPADRPTISDADNEDELSFISYAHQEIGALLLKYWDFPDSIVESALYQHDPLSASQEHQKLVCAVHIADYYAWQLTGNQNIIQNMILNINAFDVLGIELDQFEYEVTQLFKGGKKS